MNKAYFLSQMYFVKTLLKCESAVAIKKQADNDVH